MSTPENESGSSSCRLNTELTLGLPGGVELKMGSNQDQDIHHLLSTSSNSKGWPPVKTHSAKGKYVIVSVDGNPILRKINLEASGSYRHLTAALEEMVVAQSCCRRRSSFTVAYQDKDGDWMLVGDVPWRMFVDSCKRLRLMDSSSSI